MLAFFCTAFPVVCMCAQMENLEYLHILENVQKRLNLRKCFIGALPNK